MDLTHTTCIDLLFTGPFHLLLHLDICVARSQYLLLCVDIFGFRHFFAYRYVGISWCTCWNLLNCLLGILVGSFPALSPTKITTKEHFNIANINSIFRYIQIPSKSSFEVIFDYSLFRISNPNQRAVKEPFASWSVQTSSDQHWSLDCTNDLRHAILSLNRR